MALAIKKILVLLTAALLLVTVFSASAFAQMGGGGSGTQPCEKCGMTVDALGQARCRIVDANGTTHYVCSPCCALGLLKTYGQLNYTMICDEYGPNYTITINAKQYGSLVTVNPPTALFISGGGCTKNRVVYNSTAADVLLSTAHNGTSQWLSPITNATVAANATRLTIYQAALQFGGGTNMTCERCGMTVDVTGQQRFRILDATGTVHVACCPMCALMLQRTYNDINVTSFCDYYGPNYPITIISRNNGTDVTVTPSTALIIAAGGCTKNRIVYNSTAADELFSPPYNGTSKYLSTLQNATAGANVTRYTVVQAALMNGAGTPSPTPTPTPSPTASPTPTTSPTPTPTSTPTQTPRPTTTPTIMPSPSQSDSCCGESPAPNINDQVCELCGMSVDSVTQAKLKVFDANGTRHYVEAMDCALWMLPTYGWLNITATCDWYGPNYAINIILDGRTNATTVNPPTALYIDGDCTQNRVVYNQTAADALMANQGISPYLAAIQNVTVPSNATIMSVAQAADLYAYRSTSPTQTTSPSPSFTPTSSSAPIPITNNTQTQGLQATEIIVITAVAVVISVAVVIAIKKMKRT